MSNTKIIISKSKVYSDGTSPVMIQVYHDGKRYHKQIDRVPLKYFDSRRGLVRSTFPNYKKINIKIDKKLNDVKSYLIDCEIGVREFNTNELFERVDRSLLYDELMKKVNFEISRNKIRTANKWNSLANKVKGFDPNSPLKFTNEWLVLFNDYLIDVCNNASTTRERDLRNLRQYSPDAFEGFRMPLNKSTKIKKLDPEEIQILESHKFVDDRIQLAVDMWLFSYYNWGIRAHNVITMMNDNIDNGYLIYSTQKNPPKTHRIRMNEKSIAIIKKYHGVSKIGYLFPVMDSIEPSENRLIPKFKRDVNTKNSMINKRLKIACKRSGINKELTMHMARHTFTFIVDTKGVHMALIQDMLGHENRETTEMYARKVRRSDELNDAIDGLI